MELISPIHGKITYEEDELIEFKKGIPGFEDYRWYIIKDIENTEPFKILQSVENWELGFIIISPFEVEPDYEISLTDAIIKDLNIVLVDDVVLFSLVTLNSSVENITANLKSPILININEGIGAQFIVDKEKYKIKHPLK